MAVSLGLFEDLTLDDVAKEAGVPGTLEGDQPNLLRAWATALGGAERPSDIAGIPESMYQRILDSFDPYGGDDPLPGGPSDKKLTPVLAGRISHSGSYASRYLTVRNSPSNHRWAPQVPVSMEAPTMAPRAEALASNTNPSQGIPLVHHKKPPGLQPPGLRHHKPGPWPLKT